MRFFSFFSSSLPQIPPFCPFWFLVTVVLFDVRPPTVDEEKYNKVVERE